MYYYKVLENEILKYEVSYDLGKVRGLLKDLVKDCSEEEDITYTSYGIPHRDKHTRYKKFDYHTSCGNYIRRGNYFRWNRSTLSDPDGYLKKTANQILADLFN